MNANQIEALKKLFPTNQCYTDPSDCFVYGYDNSRRHALPSAVVFAHNALDIQKLILFCHEHIIPLTAHGRASATTGATVPLVQGIVLSLERMQNIIEFDPLNRTMIVEAGVLNANVQTLAQQKGLFWAPNPSSAAYCTVGGNLACNAAGPRALKYGTTRENTLGLKAITGTGERIECGVYTSKGVIGYDLTRLLIGSEGTLGIIFEATLKLLPLQPASKTIRLFYKDLAGAASAVNQIMTQPIIPYGCEFLDGTALHILRKTAQMSLPEEAHSMLMVEIDGFEEDLSSNMNSIIQACSNESLVDIAVANTPEEASALWQIRKSLSQALRSLSPHKVNEDVVVPVSQLSKLFAFTQELSQKHDIIIVNFGHAGNGNIHVNMLLDPHDPVKGPLAKTCLAQLFDYVLSLRGSLSGEHGIGLEKREFMSKQLSPTILQLMKQIKAQFDPKSILNPDKLFPT